MNKRNNAADERPRPRSRMGPWRLLDIMQASVSMRGMSIVGGQTLPEYGPPDVTVGTGDPESELPGSNISDGERRQAAERESARRFVRARRQQNEA